MKKILITTGILALTIGFFIFKAEAAIPLIGGDVTIIHANKQGIAYPAAANTDSARGTALLTACSALSDKDTIEVGFGTYDMSSNNCDLSKGGTLTASLKGKGKNATIIKSSILSVSGTNSCIIDVSSTTASTVSDLSIVGTASGSNQCPVGTVNTNVTNLYIDNVFPQAESDGVMIAPVAASAGTSTAKINKLSTGSNWDSVLWRVATGTLDIYDSDLVSVASSSALVAGSNLTIHGIVNQGTTHGSAGVVNIYNTKISATGGSVSNVAIQVLAVNGKYPPTNFYSGSTTSSGTGLLDISGPASVDSAAVYDPTKTSGTITYLNGSPTLYAVGSTGLVNQTLQSDGTKGVWSTLFYRNSTLAEYDAGTVQVGSAGSHLSLPSSGEITVTGGQFQIGVGGDQTWFDAVNDSGFGLGTNNPLSTLSVKGNCAIGTYADVTPGPTNGCIISGNVGIGTTSPYAALSVVGSSGIVAGKYTATSTTASSTFAGAVGIASSSPYVKLSIGGNNALSSTTILMSVSSTSPQGVTREVFSVDQLGHMSIGWAQTANTFSDDNDINLLRLNYQSFNTANPQPIFSQMNRAGTITFCTSDQGTIHVGNTLTTCNVSTGVAGQFDGLVQIRNLNNNTSSGSGGGGAGFQVQDRETPTNGWQFYSTGGNFNMYDTTIGGNAYTITPGTSKFGLSSSTPWGKMSIEMDTTNPAFVVANQGSTTPSFVVTGVNQNGIVAVGSSTPNQNTRMTISGQVGDRKLLAIASSTATSVDTLLFTIDNKGHKISSGSSPTMGSCGTNPAIQGDDSTMRVTAGSGVLSSCTVNFASTWTKTDGSTTVSPACHVEDTAVTALAIDATSTPTTVTFSGTSLTSASFTVMCQASDNFPS